MFIHAFKVFTFKTLPLNQTCSHKHSMHLPLENSAPTQIASDIEFSNISSLKLASSTGFFNVSKNEMCICWLHIDCAFAFDSLGPAKV